MLRLSGLALASAMISATELTGKRRMGETRTGHAVAIRPCHRCRRLCREARRLGYPLAVLDIDTPQARALYGKKLVLVRPDQHVAWRGDTPPAEPRRLIELVRGARAAPARATRCIARSTIRRVLESLRPT
jgi:hypothetical protein